MNIIKSTWKWLARNQWWLITAAAMLAAGDRLVTAAVAGTKVSSGEFIFWVSIALLWMLTQFLTERRERRSQRRRQP